MKFPESKENTQSIHPSAILSPTPRSPPSPLATTLPMAKKMKSSMDACKSIMKCYSRLCGISNQLPVGTAMDEAKLLSKSFSSKADRLNQRVYDMISEMVKAQGSTANGDAEDLETLADTVGQASQTSRDKVAYALGAYNSSMKSQVPLSRVEMKNKRNNKPQEQFYDWPIDNSRNPFVMKQTAYLYYTDKVGNLSAANHRDSAHQYLQGLPHCKKPNSSRLTSPQNSIASAVPTTASPAQLQQSEDADSDHEEAVPIDITQQDEGYMERAGFGEEIMSSSFGNDFPFYQQVIEMAQFQESKGAPKEPQMYRPLSETPCYFVDTPDALIDAIKEIDTEVESTSGAEIAIDLEAHSKRSFLGFTCLIQLSTRSQDFIFDTLRLREEMYLLQPLLMNPRVVKVLHGSESDIVWLQRDFGLYLGGLFDTGIAAKLLNLESYSLAHLLSHYCNINTGANKKRYQRADWRVRPLPKGMFDYARSDTHYLLYIYDRMRMDLAEKKMLELCINSSAHRCLLKYEKLAFRPSAFRKLHILQKAGNVVPMESQDRVAAILWDWRDKVARKEDESLHYVLPIPVFREIVLAADHIRDSHSLLRVARRAGLFDGLRVLESHAAELAELVSDALNAKDVVAVDGQLARTNECPSDVGGQGDSLKDVTIGPSVASVPKEMPGAPEQPRSAIQNDSSLLEMKESSLFASDVTLDSQRDSFGLQKPSLWTECYQAIANMAQSQFSSHPSTLTKVANEPKSAAPIAAALCLKPATEPITTDSAAIQPPYFSHPAEMKPESKRKAKTKTVPADDDALPLSLAEKFSKKGEISLKSKKRKHADTEGVIDNVEEKDVSQPEKGAKVETVPVAKKIKDNDVPTASIFQEPFDLGLEPKASDEKQRKGSVNASAFTKRQALAKAKGGKYNPFGTMMEDRKKVAQGKVRPASGLRTLTYKPTGKK